jgi:hypothetical protein
VKKLKLIFAVAAAAACFVLSPPSTHAQIAVQIGPAPVCPYGYFDYPPYECAPYGYYGPEWFTGGVFIGAGPWYRGPGRFWGHVDNRYDRHDGWHGDYPRRGEHWDRGERGNEMRDGHGHSNLGNGHEHGGDHRH